MVELARVPHIASATFSYDARDGVVTLRTDTLPSHAALGSRTQATRMCALPPSCSSQGVVETWDAVVDLRYMRDIERTLVLRPSNACYALRTKTGYALDTEKSWARDMSGSGAVALERLALARMSESACDGSVSIVPRHAAGLGVFTTTRLPRGVVLGWYRGRVLAERQVDAVYGPDVVASFVLAVIHRGVRVFVDSRFGATANWTSCVNDPRGTGLRANVEFTALGGVKTIRTIEPGEEILVDYDSTETEPRDDEYLTACTTTVVSSTKKHSIKARHRRDRVGMVAGFCDGCSGVAPLGAAFHDTEMPQ